MKKKKKNKLKNHVWDIGENLSATIEEFGVLKDFIKVDSNLVEKKLEMAGAAINALDQRLRKIEKMLNDAYVV